MNTDKSKPAKPGEESPTAPPVKASSAAASADSKPQASPRPKTPALFRPIDWFTFALVTTIVMIGYWLTLAPDLTLEDSGELAVASLYAGIPHPPGYPVWTVYTWLWANFVPFHNIAWRVALGEAFAGAVACGLLGLIVSRGSSLMMEGIEGLKSIDRKWENAICVVSGFVAGTLMGFNGYMWSQSVIVEVYSFSVLSLMGVLVFLLRWMYAPQQRRYLYWAFFIFGICFTNHQTLIVAAMGLEIAIAAVDSKLGRSMFMWNSIAYLIGLVLRSQKMMFVDTNPMVFVIFNVIGLASIAAYVWFAVKTEKAFGKEDLSAAFCGGFWILGAAFYLYMALAGMSTPPMQWGYPRTVEGFMHALTRGQYEKTNPTDLLSLNGLQQFLNQLGLVGEGIVSEFNWVYSLLALIPFLFFFRMQKRERAWMIGLAAIYLCLSVLLVILLNPSLDRQSRSITRVFFTASHVMIVIWIGYGLTLITASMAQNYQRFRKYGILGAIAALDFATFALVSTTKLQMADVDSFEKASLLGLFKVLCWILAGVVFGLVSNAATDEGQRDKGTRQAWLLTLPVVLVSLLLSGWLLKSNSPAVFSAISAALQTIATAFRSNHYGLPIYAELLLLVGVGILFLSYLINRKHPVLVLALVIFAIMPLHTVLSNWSDNEQRNHLFGYWFGHDMFTPPFENKEGRLSYDPKERAELMKDPAKAKLIYPEMMRDAVLYGGTDPGRFCPTYMIFCESFIPPRCKPNDPNFDRRDVYIITQNALADGTYLMYIRSHYNKSTQIQYDKPFFREVAQTVLIRKPEEREYRIHPLSKLAFTLLDKPFLALGNKIEAQRRADGVYPKEEMYIATPEDSQRCFSEYMEDAQRRMQVGQLRPGEDVRIQGGRVQVSGQVAVMAINGLISKVMFEKNPTNEFFVEESFPMEWMYPHLTPFGVIMKVNREKLPTLSEEVLQRDHEFWSKYSERLIGNWITYDTSVQDIAAFVEKVYLRRDFNGFQGDRKFVRDDQAQKAFSKLRSSIAGVFAWRLGMAVNAPTEPQYMPKTAPERDRLIKETDFAFKQAFAFCPYSPEAVFRYMQVLLNTGRIDDAILVVSTALKLDPNNTQLAKTVQGLQEYKSGGGPMAQLQKLQAAWQQNPTNLDSAITLARAYVSLGQTASALQVVEDVIKSPHATPSALIEAANICIATRDITKLEAALQRITEAQPDSPEAWYDLAALKATLGKTAETIPNLRKSIAISDTRLAKDDKARNLRQEAAKDERFGALRQNPEFQALMVAP